ncbi:site-specific integrase [Hymenobacter sp. UV11]|uniref:site-specific integrase n=1 Tax=Hymenobacter sp. UV11 TaxID=1849735 RepID=UPI001414E397|nr:site-specific integrase [Hymenobacter sp. UV11]
MSIRFWLRHSKKEGQPGVVYCTLTCGGQEATPFSTGIQAWPPVKKGQTPTPRSWQNAPTSCLYGDAPDVEADNATLGALYNRLRSIKIDLERQGLPSDAAAVVEVLRGFGKAVPTLLQAAEQFITAREKQVRPATAPAWDKSGFSPATIKKYKCRFGLLREYLKKQQHVHMPLHKFTAKHADALCELILTRPAVAGKLSGAARGKGEAHYAGKVVGWVSQVLDFAINQEWLAVNPLSAWSAPHSFEKPLVYLLPEQVAKLEAYPFANAYLQRCADSFLFSCWTGLAWADLDSFDTATHIDAAGWLEMQRTKTGAGFAMPLLPGAVRLLNKYGAAGLPRYENAPLNRSLKEIGSLLGWEMDITHHAARRTFGMFLLNEDVPLATVSAVLGHRNERTTSRYYARFIERRKVARDFTALQVRLAAGQPQPAVGAPVPVAAPAKFAPRPFRPAVQKGGQVA